MVPMVAMGCRVRDAAVRSADSFAREASRDSQRLAVGPLGSAAKAL